LEREPFVEEDVDPTQDQMEIAPMADSCPRHANSGFVTAEDCRLRIARSIMGPNASRAELLDCYLKLSQADDRQIRGSNTRNSIVTVPAPLRATADFFPKMPETSDDIITFVESFERVCVVNGVSRSDWESYLAGRLTGKALEAYSEVPIEDLRDYDRIKDSLLRRYAVNPETYRVNFRCIHRKPEETIAGLYHRLRNQAARWMEGCGARTFEACFDLVVLEQLLQRCHPEARDFVLDQKAPTAA
ncbi:hypothetical protein XELAEV_18009598mg, partial [Xenopus laevis]